MLQASQPRPDFLSSQQGPWGQGPRHLPAPPVKKEGKGGSLVFQEIDNQGGRMTPSPRNRGIWSGRGQTRGGGHPARVCEESWASETLGAANLQEGRRKDPKRRSSLQQMGEDPVGAEQTGRRDTFPGPKG